MSGFVEDYWGLFNNGNISRFETQILMSMSKGGASAGKARVLNSLQ